MGITVVEPAGNNLAKPDTTDVGGSNLDAFKDNTGKFVLNRASPDFRDSGAIMVGAASSAVPHSRLDFSNFGSRIDCYAWGQNIVSCGNSPPSIPTGANPQTSYTLGFAGTSGASAIVAGAAVLLQSWVVKHLGGPLDTSTLRARLSDPALNTHSATPINDRIGVMPDLRQIIAHLGFHRIRHRWDAIFAILFGGVIYGGDGFAWIPGSPPKPVPPRGDKTLLRSLPSERSDVLVGLAMLELADTISDRASRKSFKQLSFALMRSAVEKIDSSLSKSEPL